MTFSTFRRRRGCIDEQQPVIPGWSEGPDPESRDSGFDALHRPGMTNKNEKHLGGIRVTDTYDFVVVGGGSGGCAVAGRLSEDPKTSVAVLDAGGKNDNWIVTTPFAL